MGSVLSLLEGSHREDELEAIVLPDGRVRIDMRDIDGRVVISLSSVNARRLARFIESGGSDTGIGERERALHQRIRAYLEIHPGGGPLHLLVSDQNVEDHHVKFSLEQAVKDGDAEAEAIARALAEYPPEIRLAILLFDHEAGEDRR